MYVCVCNAVTERQVHQAIQDGAHTLRDLRRDLGVTNQCGRCAECALQCLRATPNKKNEQSHPGHTLPALAFA